jgi:hypothetical protein
MPVSRKKKDVKVNRYNSSLTESGIVLKAQTRCNNQCRYYAICPIRAIAEPGGNCLLKTLPQSDVQSFVNLFLEKRDGLIHEMLLAMWHYKMSSNVTGSKRDAKEYLNMLITFHREIYGSAKGTEAIKDLEIVVTQVGMEQPPEDKGRLRKINSESDELDGIVLDADIYDPDDPESLFNSEVIDDKYIS